MGESVPARAVVVCGHLCLDVIPGFPSSAKPHDYFKPGTLSIVGAPSITTGGAVPNVGISLRRLGIPARLVAKIGTDALGRLVQGSIAETCGEPASGIMAVEGEVTSFTVVLNPPGIDRLFLHCPGANDTFTEDDVQESALEDAALFHFGYPPLMKLMYSDGGSGLRRLFHRAKAHGAFTSLDMSLPDPDSESGRVDWDSYLSRVLPDVGLFAPSVDELFFMLDRRLSAPSRKQDGEAGELSLSRLAAMAGRILGYGARAVLIKLGEKGAYLRTGPSGLHGIAGWEGRELYCPAFTVERPAGTTGAGDAAIAGLLASIYKGLPPERALTLAMAVGACCVEAPDATSGVRSWDETVRRVDSGWGRAASCAAGESWTGSREGFWRGPRDRGASV